MQGIANIQARIQSIQARIGEPRDSGQFGSVLKAKMSGSDDHAAHGHDHDHLHGDEAALALNSAALDARALNARAGITLGTMISGTGPISGVTGPATPPRIHHVPDGTIATRAELAEYMEANRIEARNGRLESHELVEVTGSWYNNGKLLAPAAEAWELMRAAAAEDGIDLKAIDTYRSWESQNRAYQKFLSGEKKANVLPPGTSRHGAGLAIDITNGSIIGRDDAEWHWLQANAKSFGWHPISNETWHWEFRGV